MKNVISIRKFIIRATAGSASFFASPLMAFSEQNQIDRIIQKSFSIDSHNHLDVLSKIEGLSISNFALAEEIKKSELSAISLTFSVDRPKLTETGEAYQRFLSGLDQFDEVLLTNKLFKSLNLSDLKSAKKKPAIIQSVEGGHFLEGNLERLELAYKRGLRQLGLLHDNQSSFPLGDIYTNPPQFGGLTEFGKEVVKECNRLGILIDVTHCSNDAIDDALKISTHPIIISHTGLDTRLGSDEKWLK
jgi:microsomal dipeptidase-like Zn-dependent dipeptidase